MRIAAGLLGKKETIYQFKAIPKETNPQWNTPTKNGKNYIVTKKYSKNKRNSGNTIEKLKMTYKKI